MLTNLQLYEFYSWSTIGTSALLILLFLIAIFIIRKEANVPFVFIISIEMIISNLGAIFVVYANTQILFGTYQNIYFIIILQNISAFLRDACFNVAHWRFSFQYYNSAIAMPYLINGKHDLPPERRK